MYYKYIILYIMYIINYKLLVIIFNDKKENLGTTPFYTLSNEF